MRRRIGVALAGTAGLIGLSVLAAGCSSGGPAPTSSAFAGNAILVPAGGPVTSAKSGGGSPQLVAYTVP